MRKLLVAIVLSVMAFASMTATYAQSITAANIFNAYTSGATTTIDRGGAIHSQTRSIYSLGGGMSTFKGKNITLMNVDPPGFSAGCSGISWHFGGFAFISMDEIRQMVESISQASLGIAVDLALNTLCPQCYAVMNKLREIANKMRNAAADSCRIAQGFGRMLSATIPSVFSPEERKNDCSQFATEENKSDSILGANISLCGIASKVEKSIDEAGEKVTGWLSGLSGSSEQRTPTKSQIEMSGNLTYQALEALGYPDGIVKNILLSVTGMVLIPPGSNSDCTKAFKNLTSASPNAADGQPLIDIQDAEVVPSGSGTSPATATDAKNKVKEAKVDANGTKTGITACYAPPLMSGVQELAILLICGFDPVEDMKRFSAVTGISYVELANTTIGAMCQAKRLVNGETSGNFAGFHDYIYTCDRKQSATCLNPGMAKLRDVVNSPGAQYTGLAWTILDALYYGAYILRTDPTRPLPDETVKIINGSGYPLYRILNIAAVYPSQANELLSAYGATIATNYVIDTLDKLMRPGYLPQIRMAGGNGALPYNDINMLRRDIQDRLRDEIGPQKEAILKRLAEKRQIVEMLLQVNKALQAEVMSQGLSGNADLAISLKRQASTKANP